VPDLCRVVSDAVVILDIELDCRTACLLELANEDIRIHGSMPVCGPVRAYIEHVHLTKIISKPIHIHLLKGYTTLLKEAVFYKTMLAIDQSGQTFYKLFAFPYESDFLTPAYVRINYIHFKDIGAGVFDLLKDLHNCPPIDQSFAWRQVFLTIGYGSVM